MDIIRKCYKCGEEMSSERRELEIIKNEYTIKLEGVKCFVCKRCGEVVYPLSEVEMLERLCEVINGRKNNEKIDYLDVSDIAELLKVSNQTIYNMIKDKRLKPVKIGRKWRFMKSDIESLLNTNNDFRIAARGLEKSISNNDLNEIEKYLESENESDS